MSEDPKLCDAGDYNLFRYCHNDPIDNVDPMGLASEQTGDLSSGTHDREWKMSATEAVWNRQMSFSSSYGAIAYGIAHYNEQQVNQVSISARTDIRGPWQSGAKTIQNLSLSSSGELKSLGNYVGYTDILGFRCKGMGNSARARVDLSQFTR